MFYVFQFWEICVFNKIFLDCKVIFLTLQVKIELLQNCLLFIFCTFQYQIKRPQTDPVPNPVFVSFSCILDEIGFQQGFKYCMQFTIILSKVMYVVVIFYLQYLILGSFKAIYFLYVQTYKKFIYHFKRLLSKIICIDCFTS